MKNNSEKKNTILGMILTLVSGVLWGGSGVCGQYLFQNKDMTTSCLVPIRLLLAGLLILIFYFIRDRKKTFDIWKNRRNAVDTVIYGLFGMSLCQFSYFQTIEWSNAGTATVIQYIGPALIVVWVCISSRRAPRLKEVIAVTLALIGIFFIATHGNPGTLALTTKALMMGLLSAVSVVIYTVQPSRLQKEFETPLILGWGMLIGGIILFIVFRPWAQRPVVDMGTVLLVGFIILFGTIAGFSMYMIGVKMIGSIKASLYACIEPVVSMIMTAIVMRVHFTIMDIIGAVLIIATIFVLATPEKNL